MTSNASPPSETNVHRMRASRACISAEVVAVLSPTIVAVLSSSIGWLTSAAGVLLTNSGKASFLQDLSLAPLRQNGHTAAAKISLFGHQPIETRRPGHRYKRT